MIAPACPVCADTNTPTATLDSTDTAPARDYARCRTCRAIWLQPLPGAGAPNTKPGGRLGSAKRAGRDYAMAVMGSTILGLEQHDMLWWQPGASADEQRISDIPLIASVHRWDDGTPARESADLLIANEVVQCLDDPSEALTAAVQALRPGGLAVLSTDINNAGKAEKMGFLRSPSHRLMWSYEAIERVVAPLGFAVDLRLPQVAYQRDLPRKRYVLITASETVRRSIRRYFGTVALAPSERLG